MAILGREKFSIRHSRHITIPVRVTIFPYEWLSSCGKKKILHSRLRRSWRIFFSPRLLSHSWGKIVTCTGIVMCLSWLIENFKFLYSRLRRSYRNFPVPKLPNDAIGSFPFRKWKLSMFTRGWKIPYPCQKTTENSFPSFFKSRKILFRRFLNFLIF